MKDDLAKSEGSTEGGENYPDKKCFYSEMEIAAIRADLKAMNEGARAARDRARDRGDGSGIDP